VPNVQINSKADIVAAVKAASASAAPVMPTEAQMREQDYSSLLPAAMTSPYGSLRFQNETIGTIGISYIVPSSKVSQPGEPVKPSAFTLDQNYPNPFNPSTVISYSLPEASYVTLRVIDMLGREVMTIVNRQQNAGSYAVTWKGLDQAGQSVASGNYFYRLDATPVNGGQPFNSMKKMTFAK